MAGGMKSGYGWWIAAGRAPKCPDQLQEDPGSSPNPGSSFSSVRRELRTSPIPNSLPFSPALLQRGEQSLLRPGDVLGTKLRLRLAQRNVIRHVAALQPDCRQEIPITIALEHQHCVLRILAVLAHGAVRKQASLRFNIADQQDVAIHSGALDDAFTGWDRLVGDCKGERHVGLYPIAGDGLCNRQR